MMRLSVQSMPLLRSSSSSSLFFFCRHVPSSPPVLLRYSVVKPLSIGGAKPSLSTSQISISRSSSKFKGGVGSVRASHQVSDAGSIDSPMIQAMENKIFLDMTHKERKFTDIEFAKLMHALSYKKDSEFVVQLFSEMKAQGFQYDCATLSSLMLCCAQKGLLSEAQALWGALINSSCELSIKTISGLVDAYAMIDEFDEIDRVLHESVSRQFGSKSEIYALALSCFGKAGKLHMMETTIKDMASIGLKVNSSIGNAFVEYYSIFGSIEEMEIAYRRLKKSRILVEKETIRLMAHAYIRKKKFYKLGEFLRDVGLGRRNTGNLLWNLLLLSYAANFKMKTLQREFLEMLGAGFSPDLTTFNIRALAFSRMSMFWDLHLSIKHMKHEKVVPDLVTYGCIIDFYLDKRLGRNLSFAMNELDVESSPVIATDPLVFEAFGKGDFHSSSEVLLESNKGKDWTYSKLAARYMRKQYRSNQIFWNY